MAIFTMKLLSASQPMHSQFCPRPLPQFPSVRHAARLRPQLVRSAKPSNTTEPTRSSPRSSAATSVSGKEQKLLPSPEASSIQQPASNEALEVSAVCPICLETKLNLGQTGTPTYRTFSCQRCNRTFAAHKGIPDLTLTSGLAPGVYQANQTAGTETFRNPLVSYVYERGWRQSFKSAGFPGADEEFRMAMDFLRPAYGEVLVDLSCGSGLFTRRFVGSSQFEGVIAADYSETMLQQTRQLFNEQPSLDSRKLGLVRADVARLPFATGSLSAIHAGAAIHCWPDPTAAMVEISRVLKPGGIFVASTFLKTFSPLGEFLGDDVVRPLNQLSSMSSLPYRWWEEQELRELTTSMGLQNFQRHRINRFIMFAVTKPHRQ